MTTLELDDAQTIRNLTADLERMNAERGRFTLEMSPVEGFTFVAALQLASMHPNITPHQHQLLVGVARKLQEFFDPYPTAKAVLEKGWDLHRTPHTQPKGQA